MQDKQVEKCLRLLVRCSVRFLIVGGLGGGQLEEQYTEAANKIMKGHIKTAAKLLETLIPAVPADPEFEAAFAIARAPQSQLARYYLRALELHKAGDPDAEWQPSEDKEINLEHVLPEHPSDEWTIKTELVEAYFERLGNLALLKKRVNKKLANGLITVKAARYKNSIYKFTNELEQHAVSGPPEIDARQKKMAAIAVQTWPLST